MTIKYNNLRYKLKLPDYLKIKYYQFVLWSIRRLRRIKRIFCEYSKPLIPLFILFFVYLAITYYIGIIKYKYCNFFDAIWDSKEFIFFSLLYVYFNIIFGGEKERHKKLKEQSYEAPALCYYSNCTIKSFLNLVNLNYTSEIFFNETRFKIFMKYLKSKSDIVDSPYINSFDDLWINELIKLLSNIYNKSKNNQYIMSKYDKDEATQLYDKLLLLSNNLKISVKNTQKLNNKIYNDIINLSQGLFNGCVLLRKFWRQDDFMNQKIRYILLHKGIDNSTEKIENLKMFF